MHVGHREVDWRLAFDNGWDMVTSQSSSMKFVKQPKYAYLMRDGEEAISKAWEKSKWPKQVVTGQCCKHSQWNAQQQKMTNGEPFGPERDKAWYSLVFKTCSQSFMDSAGETIALWESRGDHVGSQHLRKLVQTPKAPLFRWPPFPAPSLSAQGAESINQLIKKSPKDGTRRMKQTFLQFARNMVSYEGSGEVSITGSLGHTCHNMCARQVSVAYRSYRVLVESPNIDEGLRKNRIKKLQRNSNRKTMNKGKYAVLLACLQQLTFWAFKMVEKMVAEGENHHVLHGKHEVWSNYQALSHPDNKYIHLIQVRHDV